MKVLRKLLLGILGAVVIGFGILLLVRARGGLTARVRPTAIETMIARRIRGLATPSRVKQLKNPIESTPLSIAEARDHYADHCAACHDNSGDGDTMLGEGMYPPPPDLRDETQGLSDGEIFNIIKEGVPFSGMPGFGGDDEDNWKLVLFVRHLPKLSRRELELIKEVNNLPDTDGGHEHHERAHGSESPAN